VDSLYDAGHNTIAVREADTTGLWLRLIQAKVRCSQYPAKVIALYEDSTDGTFKALIHSVNWKLNTNPEGPYGDSRLVTHYRLQFDNRGDPNLMSVPFHSIVRCVVGYEAIVHREPLIPRVHGGPMQKRYTVMIVHPRREWAKLYLDWMKELRTTGTVVA
jgi:hypothetical protein